MENREIGRGGGGWDNNQPPSTLDQQAFMESISAVTISLMRAGVIVATIAQACATGNQEGLSNLQIFEAHLPPTLEGGGDLEVTCHYSRLVRKDVDGSSKKKGEPTFF